MTTLLAGYILSAQGDRMLMANSVEGRFPFLDRDVVELSNGLPARQKLMGLDEKHILKREFADLLPSSILRRPKQPYRAPDAASFFLDAAPDWVEAATDPASLKAAGIFSPEAVGRLVEKCRRERGEKYEQHRQHEDPRRSVHHAACTRPSSRVTARERTGSCLPSRKS